MEIRAFKYPLEFFEAVFLARGFHCMLALHILQARSETFRLACRILQAPLETLDFILRSCIMLRDLVVKFPIFLCLVLKRFNSGVAGRLDSFQLAYLSLQVLLSLLEPLNSILLFLLLFLSLI